MLQSLHVELAQRAEVHYFLEDNGSEMEKLGYLSKIANTRPIEEFNAAEYEKLDAVVYHIGNSDYHLKTYWLAQCFPGHVILHDTRIETLLRMAVKKNVIHRSRLEAEKWFDQRLDAKNSRNLLQSG